MRLTIFVTLISLSSFAQVGLNGQISTQSGFTRAQLERAVNAPTAAPTTGTPIIVYNNAPQTSCFKTACRMAGEFGCDDQDEVIGMNQVCRSQASDECLLTTCQNLGQFSCDEFSEIRRVLVTNCGSDEILRPTEQRVQDLNARQRQSGF